MMDLSIALLLQSVWLSITFVVLLGMSWLLRYQDAHTRYWTWSLFLAKCCLPVALLVPVAVLPTLPTSRDSAEVFLSPHSQTLSNIPVDANGAMRRDNVTSAMTDTYPTATGPSTSPRAFKRQSNPEPAITKSSWISWLLDHYRLSAGQTLTLLWVVVSIVFLVRTVQRIIQQHKALKQWRRPISDASQACVQELAKQLGWHHSVAVYLLPNQNQPMVSSFPFSALYLPASWDHPNNIESSQRAAIIKHELAHIIRRDPAWNLLQLIIQCFYFFHPLVWWANHRLRQERESCCDEIALADLQSDPRDYCHAILDLAGKPLAPLPGPILTITGTQRNLEKRFVSLLRNEGSYRRRVPQLSLAGLLALAALLLPFHLAPASSVGVAEATPAVIIRNAALPSASTTDQDPSEWESNRKIMVTAVDQKTRQPLEGVKLLLQNQGPGIDFSKYTIHTTDASGKAELTLSELPSQAIRIYSSHPGYVPLRFYWEDKPFAKIADQVTLALVPGVTVGGIVKNSDGKPIPDTKVSVWYYGPEIGDHPTVRANFSRTSFSTQTDQEGRWKFDNFPEEIVEYDPRAVPAFKIYFSHVDYVQDHFRPGYVEHSQYPTPDLKELYSQTAETILKPGELIQATVVDSDKSPIAGAVVHDRPDFWTFNDLPKHTSDDQGKIQFRQTTLRHSLNSISSGEYLLVEATGFAPKLIHYWARPLPLSDDEIIWQLEPGYNHSGTVLDSQGMPVAGAFVRVASWNYTTNWLNRTVKTDERGRFSLNDLPAGEILYTVSAKDYTSRSLTIDPSADTDKQVVLVRPLKVSGRVVDSDSGLPIPKFLLKIGNDWVDSEQATSWQPGVGEAFLDGQYNLTLDSEQPLCRLRIEAEGYLPAESATFPVGAGDPTPKAIDFRLRKSPPITGSVIGPDGAPKPDAQVYVVTDILGISNKTVLTASLQKPALTDSQGIFQHPPEVEPFCLVVVHQDGLAMLTEKDVPLQQPIVLEPWTAENVDQQVVRRPAKGQYVTFPVPEKPNGP